MHESIYGMNSERGSSCALHRFGIIHTTGNGLCIAFFNSVCFFLLIVSYSQVE